MRLSEAEEAKARRLYKAAEASFVVGRTAKAAELSSRALALTSDPYVRADIQQLRSSIECWGGRVGVAHELLVAESARLAPTDPVRAGELLGYAVNLHFGTLDAVSALELAERAWQLASPEGTERELPMSLTLAAACIMRGQSARAVPLLRRAVTLSEEADEVTHASFAAVCLVWIEEYDVAERLLRRCIAAGRAASAAWSLSYDLEALANVDARLGRISGAYAAASESVSLAEATGLHAQLGASLATLARVEAIQGRIDGCRAHAAEAFQLSDATGVTEFLAHAQAALGLLALGTGEPAHAAAELGAVARLTTRGGVGEPGVVPFAADLVEAYVHAGRPAEAADALEVLERQARAADRAWALAAAARCRGLVASDREFDDAFAEALVLHDRARSPFERARTELCYGESLRRARRRVDARERLRAALETFERAGASPWAERARAELRASGETARRREAVPSAELTPQELQVAIVVAGGATNQEAAAQLFLSPKTIEFHLGNVYRKLEIRSRTELAAKLVGEGVAQAA